MTSVTRDTESALTKNRPAVDASESLVTTRSSAINEPHHLASRSSEQLQTDFRPNQNRHQDRVETRRTSNTFEIPGDRTRCATRTVHLHVFRPTSSRQSAPILTENHATMEERYRRNSKRSGTGPTLLGVRIGSVHVYHREH